MCGSYAAARLAIARRFKAPAAPLRIVMVTGFLGSPATDTSPAPQSAVKFAGFAIWPGGRRLIHLAGAQVAHTAMEFDLLFASHAGEVFSRGALLAAPSALSAIAPLHLRAQGTLAQPALGRVHSGADQIGQ